MGCGGAPLALLFTAPQIPIPCGKLHHWGQELHLPRLNYSDPSLPEAQLFDNEKSFEVSISLNSRGIFKRYFYLCIMSVRMCVRIHLNCNMLLLWL